MQDLPRRIRDVILASHHLRHRHEGIVDHDGEVVGGETVRAQDHRVADDVGVDGDAPADQIVEAHLADGRDAESHRGGLPRRDARSRLGDGDRAAPS